MAVKLSRFKIGKFYNGVNYFSLEEMQEIIRRVNTHDDLLESCQVSFMAINELLSVIDNFVALTKLEPFPRPPMERIKQSIINAGGTVYETIEDAQQFLGEIDG